MSIARSLRKAGYLKPVADAFNRYLTSVDKKRREEEDQAQFLNLLGQVGDIDKATQRGVSKVPIGSGITETTGDLGVPREPTTPPQGFQNIPSRKSAINKYLSGTEKGRALGLSGLLKAPQKAKRGQKQIGDQIFSTTDGVVTDFEKPVFDIPQEEKTAKQHELSPGEILVDESGEEIARGIDKTTTQKRFKTGGYWGDDGHWVDKYNDNTEVRTKSQKPTSEIDANIFETRKNINTLKNTKPDSEGYYPNGDNQEEHNNKINKMQSELKFLRDEKGKGTEAPKNKYYNKTELSEFKIIKGQGTSVEEAIKYIETSTGHALGNDEANELRKIWKDI